MNVYLFAAVILLLPALCTALGAAGVFLVRRADEPRTRRMLCGMAAGIMLAASVWSLLLPAIERAEAGTLPVWLAPAVGLVLGAVGLLRLEEAAGRLMHTGSKEHGRMGRVVLAVTLHNLPEGMVVGLAAALALQGEPEAVSGALALALGIGLQNIPEGAAGSLPLVQGGQGESLLRRCGVWPRGAAGGIAGAGSRGLGERGSAVAHERRRRVHGLRDGSGDDTGSRGAGRTGGRHQRGAGVRPHDGAGYCAVAKKPMQLHRLFCCQFSFAR